MKLKFLLSTLICITMFFLMGCSQTEKTEPKPPTLDDKIETMVQSMNLEKKIGQMMLVGISGTKLNDEDIDLLNRKHVGGVILFDWNMKNPKQVTKLNKQVQERGALTINKQSIPLFIAVDEEGGYVARMCDKWPDGKIPSQEALGLTDNPQLAKEWSKKVSRSLKTMGFNLNFAPVADLGMPSERSYSKDSSKVTKFVDAAMEGYAEEKIISCLKHFPGIGKAVVDSHIDGSAINANLEDLEKEDLIPFARMIAAKNHADFMVMVSHLSYPALDSEYPSSLSKNIITDLLKGRLKYQGLVITDDLEMGAVAKHYSFEKMGVSAIKAGVDIALVCHEYKHILAVREGLLKAVRAGEISEARIDESVKKILKTKLTMIQTMN